MPWRIQKGHSKCPSSKPWGVVKEADGSVAGCHSSRAGAIRQQRALYRNAASVEEGIISQDNETIAEADMTENVTNGTVIVDEETVEELASEELSTDAMEEQDPIAWSGPIALEGVPTGDSGMKRYLMPGSLGWRDLPMTLMAQFVNSEGHQDAVVAGRIDSLRRDDSAEVQKEFGKGVTVVWGEGIFDSGEAGQEAARMVGDQIMRGISIDLTDAVWKLRDPEDNALYAMHELPEELAEKFYADELQVALESGKIGAATIVAIPALEDASVAIAAAANKGAIVFNPQTKGTSLDAQIEDAIEALNRVTQKERYEGYKLGLELGVLTQEDIFKAEGREITPTPIVVEEEPGQADPEEDQKQIILTALEAITDRLAAGDKLNESMITALSELTKKGPRTINFERDESGRLLSVKENS